MIYNIFNNNLLDIINYEFPEVVKKRAKEELGITDERTFNLVEISLKDYFYVIRKNLKKNKKFKLEMLDRPADVLWHNFILDTKSYSEFCNNYIGHFIHHKPYVEAKELSKSELEKIENYYSEVFKSIYISTDFKLFSSIRKDKEWELEKKEVFTFNKCYLPEIIKKYYKGLSNDFILIKIEKIREEIKNCKKTTLMSLYDELSEFKYERCKRNIRYVLKS